MDKHSVLNKLSKEEDKLLISKILDKYEYTNTRNKISTTSFLNLAEKRLAHKVLVQLKIDNFLFFGGYDDCERCVIIFYPSKFDFEIVKANFKNVVSIIRIELPKELQNLYSHRDYLGGLMKLGITREKIGDIQVFDDGADIIVAKDMEKYLLNSLSSLTRFKKSTIETVTIDDLRISISEKEITEIIIPSLRLDSIVAEIIHSSRTKSCEMIASERVFVNFELETKTNKILKAHDILTVRGYGRYEIGDISGTTRKGNIVLTILKT